MITNFVTQQDFTKNVCTLISKLIFLYFISLKVPDSEKLCVFLIWYEVNLTLSTLSHLRTIITINNSSIVYVRKTLFHLLNQAYPSLPY